MINRYGNIMDTNWFFHPYEAFIVDQNIETSISPTLSAFPLSVDETLVQFDYFMLKEEQDLEAKEKVSCT